MFFFLSGFSKKNSGKKFGLYIFRLGILFFSNFSRSGAKVGVEPTFRHSQ